MVLGKRVQVGLFGMAPDTGNMGVSALCKSFLAAMNKEVPSADNVFFDNGLGLRKDRLRVGTNDLDVTLCGVRGGRRFYRFENLTNISAWSRLGIVGRVSRVLRLIDSCAVIMDASAGDSFSDIYGEARFKNNVFTKQLAVRRAKPLLLLPQTYGPFRSKNNARLAREVVLCSGEVWARDEGSFRVLRELLADDYDPSMHRSGVDMAFGLPSQVPDIRAIGTLMDWLDEDRFIVGFNINGLVWNMRKNVNARFGFKADYQKLVEQSVRWVLSHTEACILLVPHVWAPVGSVESDVDAAQALVQRVDPDGKQWHRIRIGPSHLNEQELKWLISRCSWFCGTRMHATIAALSSGVPTASIVYSDKAAGIFECCGQSAHVIDPRACTTDAALEQFIASFRDRAAAKASLVQALSGVKALLEQQTRSIARFALRHA